MSKATPQFMPHACACIHAQSHLKYWCVSDNILCVVFQDRRTALMLAASSGSLELTTILVEAGADVNFRDKVRD